MWKFKGFFYTLQTLRFNYNLILIAQGLGPWKNRGIIANYLHRSLAEELKKDGYEINKKQIVLDSPIKYAGLYKIEIKLFVGIVAKLQVEVKVL